MRNWKMTCGVVAIGFAFTAGCQTQQASDENMSDEATATEVVMVDTTGPNDAELPLGCAPANKNPAVGWQTTGHPTYVQPGCQPVVTTAETEVITDDTVVLSDEALPPLAAVPADTAEGQNPDIVEGEGGTPCGMNVIALSSAAVGDPCMTTEGVIEALGLSDEQRDAALAGVSDARTEFSDTAVAH